MFVRCLSSRNILIIATKNISAAKYVLGINLVQAELIVTVQLVFIFSVDSALIQSIDVIVNQFQTVKAPPLFQYWFNHHVSMVVGVKL